MLLKIESFSLLSEYGIREYESREFLAGDYKWRLIIYPDGDESEKEGDYVSVYLSMVETSSLPVDWEVNAIFCAFLYNQILDNYICFQGKVRRFHAMKSKWGFPKLISKKSLTNPSNGYLVDDKCVFGAEVFVSKSQRVIECVSMLKAADLCKRDWKISQFSKLEDVWTSEQFSVGRHQWRIMLYPNGNASEKGRCVSFYLECVDSKSFAPHEKVKADFCIRIKNTYKSLQSHSRNFSNWFTSSAQNWGSHSLICIADMREPKNGFVVDDCCFLELEITVQAIVRDAPKLELCYDCDQGPRRSEVKWGTEPTLPYSLHRFNPREP